MPRDKGVISLFALPVKAQNPISGALVVGQLIEGLVQIVGKFFFVFGQCRAGIQLFVEYV